MTRKVTESSSIVAHSHLALIATPNNFDFDVKVVYDAMVD
jgi:hypothetical protein